MGCSLRREPLAEVGSVETVARSPDTTDQTVVLNADVVGYSGLIADRRDATTAIMEEYRSLAGDVIAARGGTLAQFVGDSFMALFVNAKDAVRAAIDITSDIETINAGVPGSRQVRFRMGVDRGDVTEVGGHHHGDALNIAARIQALAPPGGLSVSGRVYRDLDEPALRFRPKGLHTLKNIPERVDVYEFADLPSDGGSAADRRSLSLEAPTLAVLPIQADAVEDSVRAAASIIRGDLIHRLARVPELKVIDAGSERGSEKVTATARYMLETGVHQVGEHIRVYASLFDVTTINIVKSHKWTSRVPELFDLSERLADEVARTIEVELVVGEPAGLYAELDDPEAVENVYLGWFHLRTDTPEGWARAVELFDEVARAHPDQPYGYVLSAFANWIAATNRWGPDPKATLRSAREQAEAALDLEVGDQTGMATAVMAAVLMSEGKTEDSLATLDQLEVVRPTCDVTYGLDGSLRRYMGEWEKAVDLLDVAMRLTGINKPWYPTVMACSLFTGGRIEQAASIAEAVIEHQPHNFEALLVLAAAQSELGLDRRAHATARQIRERFPSIGVEEWLDGNPYQDREVVARWKTDLTAAGAIDAD